MKSWFLLPLFLAFASANLLAQATLSIQGTIQKSFGGAVDDGKYSLTFRLYTAESGGSPVWFETQSEIEVIGGVYSALLGAAKPLDAAFNTVYYLGISVDGGQELTPRTRLTSAPYALSLIGQGNTFPSSGTVGVGTVSPEAGNNLHVHNASGAAIALISSADNAAILSLKSGNKGGSIAIEGGNGNFNIGGENNMNIGAQNGEIHLYSNNRLKAHTTATGFMVTNNNNDNANFGIYSPSDKGASMRLNAGEHTGYMVVSSSSFQIGTENKAMNIVPAGRTHIYGEGALRAYTDGDGWVINGRAHVTSFVIADRYLTHSDERIKKNLNPTNQATDLSTLMKLQVTDYNYVDTLTEGNERVKGFIAQQVEGVYAQAVNKSTGFLPDIIAIATSVEVSGTEASVRLAKSHGLAIGDIVMVHLGGDRKELPVLQVMDANTFKVGNWENGFDSKNVLVYGKRISDFRSVDYDHIYTLNVSATQELARRVAQLEAENAALRQKTGEVDGLRSELNDMKARFSKLESLLLSNANR